MCKLCILRPAYSANTVYEGFRLDGNREVFNEFRAKWDWGFKLEGSYHFNTGNDFNVNWYHFNEKTTRSFLTYSPTFQRNIVFVTSVKPKWDAVNFELGQHVDFGNFKDIRFHGGFQYVHLTHDLRTLRVITGKTYDTFFKYKGFGPRVGMDLSYGINNDFAVYANSAAALLLGHSQVNGNIAVEDILLSARKWTVVPELELKAGAKYNYVMTKGIVTLDAGYLWVNYFNIHHSGAQLPEETNVAFTGPYVGIKWVGNL